MAANFLKLAMNSVKYWYLPLITGLIFIGVGIYSFAQPAESYVALAFVFSISFIIAGFMDIIFAVSNREELEGWGWDLALGVMTLLVGIVLIRHPEISILTLPLFVGFTVLFRSAMAIGTSLELKKYYINEWGTLMAIGILGMIFSFILIFNPVFAGLSIVIWTALTFIFIGAYSIYLSLRLKKVHDIPKNVSKEVKKRFEDVKLEVQKEILEKVDQLKSAQ